MAGGRWRNLRVIAHGNFVTYAGTYGGVGEGRVELAGGVLQEILGRHSISLKACYM